MGNLFEPEYIHLGIMFCVIAGIILIVIIFLVVYFVNEAKETKGMTKEEKKTFRAEQKASYEKALAEERSKPICANCYYYDGYGHCKANSTQKWVDNAAMDDGYCKTVYLQVRPTPTCDNILSNYSDTAQRKRDREKGIPPGFKK